MNEDDVISPEPAVEPPQPPVDVEQHKLEMALHNMLVGGVSISSAFMLIGLVLSLIQTGSLPEAVPPFGLVIPQALAFQPGGLLALGLLVLIATPILRVAGSVIGFLYERDWRYALITFIVFLIVLTSIIIGKE